MILFQFFVPTHQRTREKKEKKKKRPDKESDILEKNTPFKKNTANKP